MIDDILQHVSTASLQDIISTEIDTVEIDLCRANPRIITIPECAHPEVDLAPSLKW